MRRILYGPAALLLAVAILPGCGASGTDEGGGPSFSPGDPLVPADTASSTIGGANERTDEIQQQFDEATEDE